MAKQRSQVIGLALSLLSIQWPAQAETPVQALSKIPLLVGRCQIDLPVDTGLAFAGPRFLIFGNRHFLFEKTIGTKQHPSGLWQIAMEKKGVSAPDASGISRTRLKFRDETLWRKDQRQGGGTKIHRMDRATRKWFLEADLNLECNDFDFDLQGNLLLIGTADPANYKFRALVERVKSDHATTDILFPYPEKVQYEYLAKASPMAVAALASNYESVQINEYLVLFNPMARRVFIMNAYGGTLREVNLNMPTRTYSDLIVEAGEKTDHFGDLCWQILPKTDTDAWLVFQTLKQSEDGSIPSKAIGAVTLDLMEGTCSGEPMVFKNLHLPVFFNSSGDLVNLGDALADFDSARALTHSKAPVGAGSPHPSAQAMPVDPARQATPHP